MLIFLHSILKYAKIKEIISFNICFMSEKITENLSQAPVPVESVYTAEAFRTLLTNKGLTTVDEKTLAYIAWPIHIDK